MKKQSLLLFFFVVCQLKCMAHSPQWAIDNSDSGWNSLTLAKTYFYHSELQRQWASEFLAKQQWEGSERLLDFGCGDGKVTAQLARSIPNGNVTGVDISSNMIHIASLKFPAYVYPNLEFKKSEQIDFSDWSQTEIYDCISSFCVFHVIPNPVQVLKNLKRHLKPSGKLLLIIPAGKNPELFQAAKETFQKYGLPSPFKETAAYASTMRTLEGCHAILKEAGFEIDQIEMVDTDNPFMDREEWIEFMVGTTTANWNLPLNLSYKFYNDVFDRMQTLDPHFIDSEGRIHFKLSRIYLVARSD